MSYHKEMQKLVCRRQSVGGDDPTNHNYATAHLAALVQDGTNEGARRRLHLAANWEGWETSSNRFTCFLYVTFPSWPF